MPPGRGTINVPRVSNFERIISIIKFFVEKSNVFSGIMGSRRLKTAGFTRLCPGTGGINLKYQKKGSASTGTLPPFTV